MLPLLAPSGRRFKGGKGVATVGGAMFVLQPIISPILLLVWFGITKLTKKASLGSFAIIALLPIGEAIIGTPAWEIAASIVLGGLVLIKHGSNIKRLMRREELTLDKNH
jgi:glycerol-3-phosphate acyltransferase PlsY